MRSIATPVCKTELSSKISQWTISFTFGGFSPKSIIKRWKQKISTAHVQYDLIVRVQEYINCHLFDDLNSDKLSHVAGISNYYFRRLFKAVCGENIGIYIQRLRLEYIAFKLITADVSVPKLLGQINYQNKHTLSRAFIKESKNPIRIEPVIEKVSGIRIAYLKLERTHNVSHVYRHIYLDWLPTSDYTLREQFSFETYINTPEKTPTSELITAIYIPIAKKET